MRTLLPALLVASAVLFAGCDRGEPARPGSVTPGAAPPAPATPPATPATGAAVEPVGAPATPPETAPARQFPEDLTIDAERDPRVRDRARALNAIPVTGMKGLKVSDEATIVLVRGDRGGGTIYGSGPYTIDSQIRKAVVHNGALAHRELGVVRVKVIKHDGEHASVPQNGITPTKYGKYHTSYTIERVDVP
jgi:hypothetical protein